jgi:hypothetical protein
VLDTGSDGEYRTRLAACDTRGATCKSGLGPGRASPQPWWWSPSSPAVAVAPPPQACNCACLSYLCCYRSGLLRWGSVRQRRSRACAPRPLPRSMLMIVRVGDEVCRRAGGVATGWRRRPTRRSRDSSVGPVRSGAEQVAFVCGVCVPDARGAGVERRSGVAPPPPTRATRATRARVGNNYIFIAIVLLSAASEHREQQLTILLRSLGRSVVVARGRAAEATGSSCEWLVGSRRASSLGLCTRCAPTDDADVDNDDYERL